MICKDCVNDTAVFTKDPFSLWASAYLLKLWLPQSGNSMKLNCYKKLEGWTKQVFFSTARGKRFGIHWYQINVWWVFFKELRPGEVFQKYHATVPVKSRQFFTGLSRNAAPLWWWTKVADCLIAYYCKRSKNSLWWQWSHQYSTIWGAKGLVMCCTICVCEKYARTGTVESQQAMAILKAGKLDCINDSNKACKIWFQV